LGFPALNANAGFTEMAPECDNLWMKKSISKVLTLIAAGALLLGNARAQQTPAAQPHSAPAAKSQTGTASPAHQAPAAKSSSVPALKTQKDKASYAIGLNIGKSLHRDTVDVDPNVLLRGLRDGLTGSKPLLTEDEIKSAMLALQDEVRQRQQVKMQQAGESNKKAGEAFLLANMTQKGVVVLPSGLQYKILQEGSGPKPTATDTVVCNYRGTLLDNTEFDSSYKRGQPATFQVGQVIRGWTEALQLMPVGSKWQLFIPPDLAYGPRGAGADIGPNATLIFEVELLSIQGKGN
jgi:FKBP-type peptidyl-prolyl cis-trans isomerase FklB